MTYGDSFRAWWVARIFCASNKSSVYECGHVPFFFQRFFTQSRLWSRNELKENQWLEFKRKINQTQINFNLKISKKMPIFSKYQNIKNMPTFSQYHNIERGNKYRKKLQFFSNFSRATKLYSVANRNVVN